MVGLTFQILSDSIQSRINIAAAEPGRRQPPAQCSPARGHWIFHFRPGTGEPSRPNHRLGPLSASNGDGPARARSVFQAAQTRFFIGVAPSPHRQSLTSPSDRQTGARRGHDGRGGRIVAPSRRALRNVCTLARQASAMRRLAAWVFDPMCGVSRTLSNLRRSLSGCTGRYGSCSKTSSAAPARRPPANASNSAASSSSAPRAVLTSIADGLSQASFWASRKCHVLVLEARCRLKKSL